MIYFESKGPCQTGQRKLQSSANPQYLYRGKGKQEDQRKGITRKEDKKTGIT